jgi:DNA-directed RNA polymerase specialized sigma24 family protein
MAVTLEAHCALYQPREWQRLLKTSAVYAQSFQARLCGDAEEATRTGEDILRITLEKMRAGCDGYTFKEGDILLYHYLCRCCRRTALELYREALPDADGVLLEEDDDTPPVLTEAAALSFLDRRQALEGFVAFLKGRKLKGKLRAYCTGFGKYAAEGSDVARIAKDLRITPATVMLYRSRLRELLEEFEIARTRGAST